MCIGAGVVGSGVREREEGGESSVSSWKKLTSGVYAVLSLSPERRKIITNWCTTILS